MAGASLPENDLELSLEEVARATGGVLHGSPSARARGVVTDTRAELRGALFVALTGERFDAHDFVQQASERGAAAVVVERDVETSLPTVRVASTLAALGALGALRRRAWGGKLVAVAGSAGKTTTRAALSALLEAAEPGVVHYARGNFNNLVGVPLVLLSLRESDRFGVVEIGTNRPGEVATLTGFVAPDVGVLTLIGYEHTEGLGDLDGVEAEEAALFSGVELAVGNVDDERVARRLASATGQKLGYGKSALADYRLRVLGLSADGSDLEVTRTRGGREVVTAFRTSALGDAGAYAACAALAAAEALLDREISAETLHKAFASPVASEAGRLCPVELGGNVLLLDDTYNANPESMLSSIELARRLAAQRGVPLVLVLGEMRELGALSAELHRKVGEAAAEQRPALIITVSGDARLLAEAAAERGIPSEFVEDAEAAGELVLSRLAGPAVVLVKASRGVRAEKVVSRLISVKGRAA